MQKYITKVRDFVNNLGVKLSEVIFDNPERSVYAIVASAVLVVVIISSN